MVFDGLPPGELQRSRTEASVGDTLLAALESGLTGYMILEPKSAILTNSDAQAVITFEDGIPTVAYHTGHNVGGAAAIDALTGTTVTHIDVYAVAAHLLARIHRNTGYRVEPTMPARLLTSSAHLIERTTQALPADHQSQSAGLSAVESFLADPERIETIRAEARADAHARAEEWGLLEHLDTTDSDTGE